MIVASPVIFNLVAEFSVSNEPLTMKFEAVTPAVPAAVSFAPELRLNPDPELSSAPLAKAKVPAVNVALAFFASKGPVKVRVEPVALLKFKEEPLTAPAKETAPSEALEEALRAKLLALLRVVLVIMVVKPLMPASTAIVPALVTAPAPE